MRTVPVALTLFAVCNVACAQELDSLPSNTQSRWFSFENPTGGKGSGGKENMGAKGHAYDDLAPGKSFTLLNTQGAGTVRRIWFTLDKRTPEMLRSLRLDMYWDNSKVPAVSAPFGDFFSVGLGQITPFESALFTDPEARSFNCYIPMPFRTGARIVITNESQKTTASMFYDIDITRVDKQPANAAYFHAYWNRDPLTALGKDYEILPKVVGKGRFLGDNVGVNANPAYGASGWGEGEIKMYLDGDDKLPTIIGTGTEDYIGTGWGMGPFANLYQGCTVSDNVKHRWAFYRFHVPDPIYFDHDCKVTLQDIGGDATDAVRKMAAAGAELEVVTAGTDTLGRLLSDKSFPRLNDPKFPLDAWVNFYRRDDYSSTAYFYLDKPFTNLPPLPPLKDRLANLG